MSYCDDLINEIKNPSFTQEEFIDDENDELYHRASEVVEISDILKVYDKVSEKVSEASREEMIDYDTIDDEIMREVKKTSTQIKCSQIEIDDNESGRVVFDDEIKDSVTASNASMICLNGSIGIDDSLLDAKTSDEDSDDDSVNYLDSFENLAEQEMIEKAHKSSAKLTCNENAHDNFEKFTEDEEDKKAHENSEDDIIEKAHESFESLAEHELNENNANSIEHEDEKAFESSEEISNNKIQVNTIEIDSDDEIQPKASVTNQYKMSDSIIMKLQSKLKGIFTQYVDDVAQPQMTIEKLYKNSTDEANVTKNADNEASSCQQVCKLSSQAKNIQATSTFTSKSQIFTRTMEMRRRKIEGNDDKATSETSNNNSSSDLSATSEIMKRVVEFDE